MFVIVYHFCYYSNRCFLFGLLTTTEMSYTSFGSGSAGASSGGGSGLTRESEQFATQLQQLQMQAMVQTLVRRIVSTFGSRTYIESISPRLLPNTLSTIIPLPVLFWSSSLDAQYDQACFRWMHHQAWFLLELVREELHHPAHSTRHRGYSIFKC